MTYKEQLLDPRWQKRRLEILTRDGFECQLCHDGGTTLHIHHFNYRNIMDWEYQDHELITYCKHCHSITEYYKKLNKDIVIAMVIKRPIDNNTQYLYSILIDDENYVSIDAFEYEKDSLKYLMSLDTFTFYIINERIKHLHTKEATNG